MAELAPKARKTNNKQACAVSGKELSRREMISLESIRPGVAERIRRDYPELNSDALVSADIVARYRAEYVEELLEAELGELSDIERRVSTSLATHVTLAKNIEHHFETERTFGERLSDHLADFGGSWTFLFAFAVTLAVWVAINSAEGLKNAFDPYPFILLNLILSCLAAVQAPIIMMSQKRQESKDRLRSLNDYQVNLKAELEIRQLHEKIDHLLNRQWQRLVEIQKLQMELMERRRP